MRFDPAQHHRRSIRLAGYDYSRCGAYFVTVCAANRECLFGDIADGEMHPNAYGLLVERSWVELRDTYPYVNLDAWVLMPNHLHGVVVITDESGDATNILMKRKPLGNLIGAFKTISTRHINELRGSSGTPVWQRNYYEHVVRSDAVLRRVRDYIQTNPGNWSTDKENPVVYGANGRRKL
jgi:putative transposase